MTTITIDEIQARHDELARLIEQFKTAQHEAPAVITLSEAGIELKSGERYVGVVLTEAGAVSHHLVLLPPQPEEDMTWQQAIEWAESVGGTLPTRQEQALIFANGKHHMKPGWHWSSEETTDASYAWYCYFHYGNQFYGRKSYEGAARAVRRAS